MSSKRGIAESLRLIAGRFALSVGRTELPTPRGWRWVKLSEIARLESGHTPSRQNPEYWDGDIPWIGIRDAREHHGRTIDATNQNVTQLGIDNSAARVLPAGTVCLSRTASVGYAVVMGSPMATSQDFVNWVCGPELEPRFLQWVFIAEKEQLLTFGMGSTHTTIYFPEVLAFHVCIPPIDVQRRIVAKLDELLAQSRAAREQLEAVPALVEQYRQSVLAAAFRGDLTADWRKKNPDVEPASKLLERLRIERRQKWEAAELAKLKAKGKSPKDDKWKSKYVEPEPVDASNLPELPPTWCWVSLEQLSDWVTDGTHQSPRFAPTGVPFVVIGNLTADAIDWSSVTKWVTQEDYEALTRSCRPSRGDVLYSAVGSYGTAVAVKDAKPFCFQRHIAHVVSPRGLEARLLAAFLSSPALRRRADLVARGNAQKTVTLGELRKFPLPLPPQAEQEATRGLLAATRVAPELNAEGLADAVDGLERALLAKAFRGELVT